MAFAASAFSTSSAAAVASSPSLRARWLRVSGALVDFRFDSLAGIVRVFGTRVSPPKSVHAARYTRAPHVTSRSVGQGGEGGVGGNNVRTP